MEAGTGRLSLNRGAVGQVGRMRYALLCYDCEDEIAALDTLEERAMTLRCLDAAQSLPANVGCGVSVRFLPTSTAITFRVNSRLHALDGPYAQTKEQLVGLWLFDCDSLEEAILAAQHIAEARGIVSGALEIRPIAQFNISERDHVTLT